MIRSTDGLGRTIALKEPPKRIVSLVPSQTELLYDLGLYEEVAGITKFCIHPNNWFRTKTRVGGTKNIHAGTIHRIRPDLVIANKEENLRDEVEALAAVYPVWTSDINTLEDALHMIRSVGVLTGREVQANAMAESIRTALQQQPVIAHDAAYLIWKEPYMTVGSDTFIHDMLSRAGFRNVFHAQTRYPQITVDDLRAAAPRYILLSSEPYPFKEKHVAELEQAIPGARVLLVDGEIFSWYGSRLLHAPAYFKSLQLLLQHS